MIDLLFGTLINLHYNLENTMGTLTSYQYFLNNFNTQERMSCVLQLLSTTFSNLPGGKEILKPGLTEYAYRF